MAGLLCSCGGGAPNSDKKESPAEPGAAKDTTVYISDVIMKMNGDEAMAYQGEEPYSGTIWTKNKRYYFHTTEGHITGYVYIHDTGKEGFVTVQKETGPEFTYFDKEGRPIGQEEFLVAYGEEFDSLMRVGALGLMGN